MQKDYSSKKKRRKATVQMKEKKPNSRLASKSILCGAIKTGREATSTEKHGDER